MIKPFRTGRALAVVTMGLALLPCSPRGLAALQAPAPGDGAVIRGMVFDDATEEPISSATVTLIGLDQEVRTGSDGSFTLSGVPPGFVSMRVAAAGHPAVVEEIEVREVDTPVTVWLPRMGAVLSELLVVGNRDRALSTGEPRTAADLLAEEVPAARSRSGNVGRNENEIYLRGIGSITQSVDPLVYVDGVRFAIDNALEVLDRISADDVADIRVLRGPAAAFLYPHAANGVILVETRGATRPGDTR